MFASQISTNSGSCNIAHVMDVLAFTKLTGAETGSTVVRVVQIR